MCEYRELDSHLREGFERATFVLPGFRVQIGSGLILGLYPTNGRRRYKVTPSLIGCVQTYHYFRLAPNQ